MTKVVCQPNSLDPDKGMGREVGIGRKCEGAVQT